MTTSDKRFELYYKKVSFVLILPFVKSSIPAEWTGKTQCPLCNEILQTLTSGSLGRVKRNLKDKIKRHMKNNHDE